MLITPAYAQAAGGGGGNGQMLIQILPFIAIFAIMYFLIIRPQQRRMKQHQEMVGALTRGDVVVTAGGLIGKVVKENGADELTIELGENVRVKALRSTISEVRSKGGGSDDKS